MKALCLLVLCVTLLAVLQANYIVAEAKGHSGGEHHHRTDDAHREKAPNRRRGMVSEAENKVNPTPEKGDEEEKDPEDEPLVEVENRVQTKNDQYMDKMLGDQPEEAEEDSDSDRRQRKEERKDARKSRKQDRQDRRNKKKGGRDENQDEDRLSRKQQKKMERKQEKKANRKAARKAERKENKERPAEGGKTKAERKAARKAARKDRQQNRREGTGGKRQRKTQCTTESDCGDGECCIPVGRKNSHTKICHNKGSGKSEGRSCSTTCTCAGDLQCYVSNERSERPETPGHKRQKKIGSCTTDADLTIGKILTAESYNQSPAQ